MLSTNGNTVVGRFKMVYGYRNNNQKGKYKMTNQKENRRRGTKIAVLVLAFILAIGCAIGGTIAWLTDTTAPVKNTFSTSNISIKLEETDAVANGEGTLEKNYKMVPGEVLVKDPKVTVEGDSEACYLFVEIEKTTNFDTFISYAVADDWTALDGEDGVYYRTVAASADDQEFYVLVDNEVTVKDVDSATMEGAGEVYIEFTAYAIQQSVGEVADAWAEVRVLNND